MGLKLNHVSKKGPVYFLWIQQEAVLQSSHHHIGLILQMKKVCSEVDRGEISQQTLEYIEREKQRQARRQQQRALAKERPRQLSTSSVVSTCSEQE